MITKTIEYVSITDIIPESWAELGFWSTISDGAPFSWGDTSHALVPSRAFANYIEVMQDCLADIGIGHKKTDSLIKRLNKMNIMVDLET